jgi:predicted ATPase
MIGRGVELAELRGALDAARRGRGALYLLSGEPGIGKTRLADELAASAALGRTRVLWGRCHEAEGRPPYWPWAQVIQSCARDGDATELAASLLPDARPLAELVPELRPHVAAPAETQAADPDTARFRLFQVLAGCLARIAAHTPLLMILDDLHWADLPSLHMLEFLAHELPERPMVVVGTVRDAEVRRTADVAVAFDRLGRRARPLPLVGFTREEVSRFVEDAAGERVSESIVEQLHHASGGNPFFLDEIVRQARGGGDWAASAVRSHGVRSAIRQRLAPLPEATRHLLDAAAVAGRDFDLPLLAVALDVPRASVLEQLAPAMEGGIVAAIAGRAGRYRFTHALIRETIYEEVRPSQSVALHRRLGEVLEARFQAAGEAESHLPELAHHFSPAAAGGA